MHHNDSLSHIQTFISQIPFKIYGKAKLLDHEIQIMQTYFYFEVKDWVTLAHNPKI